MKNELVWKTIRKKIEMIEGGVQNEKEKGKKQKRKKTRGEDCEEKKFPRRGIDAVEGKVVK